MSQQCLLQLRIFSLHHNVGHCVHGAGSEPRAFNHLLFVCAELNSRHWDWGVKKEKAWPTADVDFKTFSVGGLCQLVGGKKIIWHDCETRNRAEGQVW